MKPRTIRKVYPAQRDDIADLKTHRALPTSYVQHLDPFLFLNHHGPQTYKPRNRGLPFGPHPHRGFETVTFILKGDIAHRDSGGHESIIRSGGVQWMTAGRGLVHSETSSEAFKDQGGELEILQLWVNLPAKLKMTEPRYVGLQAEDIPTLRIEQGRIEVRPVSGSWGDASGPIRPLTDITLLTLHLAQGARTEIPVPHGHTIFFYVVSGEVLAGGQQVSHFHLADFGPEGDHIQVEASRDSIVLFGHAQPFREPIVAHGPFVMNTEEEIVQAIRDYQAGHFS